MSDLDGELIDRITDSPSWPVRYPAEPRSPLYVGICRAIGLGSAHATVLCNTGDVVEERRLPWSADSVSAFLTRQRSGGTRLFVGVLENEIRDPRGRSHTTDVLDLLKRSGDSSFVVDAQLVEALRSRARQRVRSALRARLLAQILLIGSRPLRAIAQPGPGEEAQPG